MSGWYRKLTGNNRGRKPSPGNPNVGFDAARAGNVLR